MALNIKNAETERLAAEVADLAGETKTRAITIALRERLARLREHETAAAREARVRRFFETEIWSQVPDEVRGKPPLTKAEVEEILGYGPEGA
jgi:antitoxin VapB